MTRPYRTFLLLTRMADTDIKEAHLRNDEDKTRKQRNQSQQEKETREGKPAGRQVNSPCRWSGSWNRWVPRL